MSVSFLQQERIRAVAVLFFFALECAPSTSVVPHTAMPSIPQCPAGYFRSSLLLFPCNAEGEKRSYAVATVVADNVSEVIGVVPPGVKSLVINVNSAVHVWLELYEGNEHSQFGNNLLTFDPQHPERSFTFYGVTVAVKVSSAANAADLSQLPFQEHVEFNGSLPANLVAALRSNDTWQSQARAYLTYSYDGFPHGECLVPVGCTQYAKGAAAEILAKFSKWMEEQYSGKHASLSFGSLFDHDRYLHFHDWPRIWARWPLGEKYPWKECFEMIDSLIDRDGVISEAEIEKVPSWHTIYPSLSIWSGLLHGAKHAKTADEAWRSLYKGTDTGLSLLDWTSKWEVWPAPRTLDKVSADQSFNYVDSDSNGWISQAEFRVAYDVFYMGRPMSLQEINTSSASLAASRNSPAAREVKLKVTDAAVGSTTLEAASNGTEEDTDSSSDMSASSSDSFGNSSEASSGDSGGWIVAVIALLAIIAAGTVALCIAMLPKIKASKFLNKAADKHRGLSPGASESRMSREMRANYNRSPLEPATFNADHSVQSVPTLKTAWDFRQQESPMHNSQALQQHLQSPMMSVGMLTPVAPPIAYSYVPVPGQSPQPLAPQPSPSMAHLAHAHSDQSSGYGFTGVPQLQYFSPGHSPPIVSPDTVMMDPFVHY